MIDPKLITFLTVCKLRNFTKAASILNLTQPAVTKQIQTLENHYGTSLLRRQGRSIELTPAGQMLLDYAIALQAQTAVLERKIKNSFSPEKRYVIGATLTIGEYTLPEILGKYRQRYPDREIIMQVQNTEGITQKLQSGELDLGLVEGPFDSRKFSFTKLCGDELVLAAATQSELAQHGIVELEQVLQHKLILREEGSGTRRVLEDKLLEFGYHLNQSNVYMEMGSLGAIKLLVESDLGYTVISKAAIQKELNAGTLVCIPIRGVRFYRDFTFIYLPESPHVFLNRFIRFAVESLGPGIC